MKSVRPLLALMAGMATLAAVVTPAVAAESRVAPDQLQANQTVTISNIPDSHQTDSLKLYRIADYTAATVDGVKLTAYDVHATSNSAVLHPSWNDTDSAKPDADASADEQLAYVLEHYQSANSADDNYGLYSSLLRDSVGAYSGKNPDVSGLPSYPVTFSGTSGSVSVPAGIYVMTDTASTGVQCQASLLATGVGGATSIGDTTLGQTTCKHVTPEAPVKKVIDSDNGNTATDLAHVSTGDIITWQISAKAGWQPFMLLHDPIPAGLAFVKTTRVQVGSHTFTSVTPVDMNGHKVERIDDSENVSTATLDGRAWWIPIRAMDDEDGWRNLFSYNASNYSTNEDEHHRHFLYAAPNDIITVTFETKVTDPSKLSIDGEGTHNIAQRCWMQNDEQLKNFGSFLEEGFFDIASSNIAQFCGVLTSPPATVKTHEITVKKTDMTGKALNGAHFTLTRNGKGVEVKNGYVSGYGTASDLTVNNTLNIKGLDTGDYVLQETAAPAGYMGVGLPTITFTMNEDGTVTEKSGDLFELVSANKNTVTVKNAQTLTQLPMTGMGGVIVAASAAGIFILLGLAIETRVRKHA